MFFVVVVVVEFNVRIEFEKKQQTEFSWIIMWFLDNDVIM